MPGARVASGERVTLRTVEREDLPFCHRADANPELRTMMGGVVSNLAQAEEGFEDQWGFDELFLVCLDDDDAGPGHPDEDATRRIGFCAAGGHGPGRPGLALFIVPAVQGEGYGREALSLVLDHQFQAHPHPAVGTKTLAHNEAARGLLESLGFTQEGRIRKDVYRDGQYRDRILYGLLRDEWYGRD